MKTWRKMSVAWITGLMLTCSAMAGGGGQDMILVVNPNHEDSLRIANAYARIRNIPDANIVFDITGPPLGLFGDALSMSKEQVKSLYVDPLAAIIAQRGLDHADYIGLLGQSTSFRTDSGSAITAFASVTDALTFLSPISDGTITPQQISFRPTGTYQTASLIPNNNALRHADTNVYMTGAIGFTGFFGNTAAQTIAGLERTAAGDGDKPQGTIYFEENNDIRSDTRENQWAHTQAVLDSRGINWVEESNTSGATPLNRSDVQGAIIGAANPVLPNGSTYLPGSWADTLTSSTGNFSSPAHTKATAFIAAGAGASSGPIAEPFAIASRFTNSNIHVHTADGSTLGEAFFKSVLYPDYQQFIGDLLAQPHADLPTVSVTGVGDGQTVAGQIQVSATATLTTPALATGIKQIELYIDGKPSDAPILAANGTFTIDTTELADGHHEIRIVALNNAPAESEGADIRHITVNNRNRSVSAGGNLTLEATQVADVAVNANLGDGTVSRIELRQLGRVLGSINAATGHIAIDAAKLAYGDNPVVPVAIYTDGSEVANAAINVHRSTPGLRAGRTPAAAGDRTAGVHVAFFNGQGATSISASTFAGTPDHTMQASELNLWSGQGSSRLPGATSMELAAHGLDVDQLAIRITAQFEIAAADAGEYKFFFYNTNDSAQLLIDGIETLAFDDDVFVHTTQFADSVFLGAGEHDLTFLAANTTSRPFSSPDQFDISLYYRGPDGLTHLADDSFLYTAPVPEPASALLLAAALSSCLTTRPRKLPPRDRP